MQAPQERILHKAKRARRGMISNYLLIIVFVVLMIYSLGNSKLKIFSLVFGVFGLFVLFYSEFKILSKRLIITDKRAVLEQGLFSKHSTTIRYTSITEVTSKQNILQRILNYGTLHIKTAGVKTEYDLVIDGIANPIGIKGIIERFMMMGHHGMHRENPY